ncbi:uncharacterized protein DS421_15g523270 [Arachis hypogaea]|nr:uncharacterized protein DS421_15g523270 [Arachis hypogaea]
MIHFTWFHEKFKVLPVDASEETVQIYACAYIMMLLSTQLFGDKSGNRVHIRWLLFVARLAVDLCYYLLFCQPGLPVTWLEPVRCFGSFLQHLYRYRRIGSNQRKDLRTDDMIIKLSEVTGYRCSQACVQSVVPSNFPGTLSLLKADANHPCPTFTKLLAPPMILKMI